MSDPEILGVERRWATYRLQFAENWESARYLPLRELSKRHFVKVKLKESATTWVYQSNTSDFPERVPGRTSSCSSTAPCRISWAGYPWWVAEASSSIQARSHYFVQLPKRQVVQNTELLKDVTAPDHFRYHDFWKKMQGEEKRTSSVKSVSTKSIYPGSFLKLLLFFHLFPDFSKKSLIFKFNVAEGNSTNKEQQIRKPTAQRHQ